MSRWGQGEHPRWQHVRRQILDRDNHHCQIREPGCTGHATTVDHIVGLAQLGIPRNHPAAINPHNLQSTCTHCHTIKTRRETSAALAQHNRERAAARHQRLTLHRPHPGDVH